MEERDIVVVGGGPAGYVAAIRAAQLGAKVTLVEAGKLGGTCLNWGCIPTKFLLHGVELYDSFKTAGQYGLSVSDVSYDLKEIQARKNQMITALVAGIKSLLAGNKVEILNGKASLASPGQVEIDPGGGEKQSVKAGSIILATGSTTAKLPIPGADSPDIMGAAEILGLERLPQSLVMIGGGIVGVELATVLAKLGCKVTIVEMLPHIVPTQDAEIATILEGILKKEGVQVYCGAHVSRIEDSDSGKLVVFTAGDAEEKVSAESVAIAVGQKPNISGLGLEECGVAIDRGGIRTDEHMRTSVPNIYAAGDVSGGMMLAYTGMAEGKAAAENALGREKTVDYKVVPQCIFTLPELASVGLTEAAAVAEGHKIRLGKFPFAASGMAAILGERRGLVKIIADTEYGQILGVHIIGPRATNLIPEATLAIKLEITAEEIVETMHAHPTLSEAIWEAALDITGESLHFHSR
ncbi:dihydrolipoyl dehydrogenase [Chloroflexota bacterium]